MAKSEPLSIDIDSDDVLCQMSVDTVIDYYGEDEILDAIDETAIYKKFGVDLLDEYSEEELRDYLDATYGDKGAELEKSKEGVANG